MKQAIHSLFCALSLALLMAANAQAESRTWTSATDPSKTFEGELLSATDTHITVRRSDGQSITFPLAAVSAADQAYAKEKAASLPSPDEAAGGPVPREIAGAISGGSAKLASAEYFIIWCAANRWLACNEEAPQVVEYYNTVITKNPKVEMIFHSWDKDAAEMRAFTSKYRIPFPAFRHGILATSRASLPTVAKHIPQKLPYFIMIDRKGDAVAEGDTDLAAIKRFFAEQEAKEK